jgi:hypothetical protein
MDLSDTILQVDGPLMHFTLIVITIRLTSHNTLIHFERILTWALSNPEIIGFTLKPMSTVCSLNTLGGKLW